MEKKSKKSSELINLRWGYDGGGMACGPVEGNTVTEATFVGSNKDVFFVSVSRMSEFANVYVSETSLFDLLLFMTRYDVDFKKILKQIEDNSKEIYELELCDLEPINDSKYLKEVKVAMIANDHYFHMSEDASAEEWMKSYQNGKMDMSWRSDYEFFGEDEEEELEEENIDDSFETMEKVFKRRLALETELKHPSVYTDIDADAQKSIKKELKKLKSMYSESLYKEWVKTYIAQEYANHKDEKWVTVAYLFAGMGQYSRTFPEAELECFKAWIDGNGSAFMGNPEPATEEEIKTAIALAAEKNK